MVMNQRRWKGLDNHLDGMDLDESECRSPGPP